MSEQEKLSRQQLSARKRKEAGLTQVKVYLDQATLELLDLLQKNVMDRDVKGDERNLSRSSAVIASIHTLARRRLGEDAVSEIMEKHLGDDYPREEAYKKPASFILRSMINQLYSSCKSPFHWGRLKYVAESMNKTSFRNPGIHTDGVWSPNEVDFYVNKKNLSSITNR
ncbi:hypothetical protein [Aeromonas veronii]